MQTSWFMQTQQLTLSIMLPQLLVFYIDAATCDYAQQLNNNAVPVLALL
jgi:hypothetical protein